MGLAGRREDLLTSATLGRTGVGKGIRVPMGGVLLEGWQEALAALAGGMPAAKVGRSAGAAADWTQRRGAHAKWGVCEGMMRGQRLVRAGVSEGVLGRSVASSRPLHYLVRLHLPPPPTKTTTHVPYQVV